MSQKAQFWAWATLLWLMPRLALSDTVVEPGAEGWDVPPPVYVPEFREESNILFGIDFGIGGFWGDCRSCPFVGGGVVGITAGIQLSGRVALLAQTRAVLHPLPSESDFRDGVWVSGYGDLSAQFWMTPTLWMRAGIGANVTSKFVEGPDEFRTGPAMTLSIGSEQKHRPSYGIDLAVHVGFSALENGPGEGRGLLFFFAPTIGAHWN